ncbi:MULTISPECIES: non-ribosomal peptide synthetase [unclassified Streptomyces]|uniref:non-ribosomal peptide synthetase n=1 Tax=Streptomyces sp. NPDC055082 TaxID=3365718 RepID=UPI0037D71FDA
MAFSDSEDTASVQRRFAAQVARVPDAVALSGRDGSLTYRELDRRANRLAHRLLALGVRPEEPVAVLMERSVDLVVSLLAVVKAGGCYLPLHSAHPVELMRRIVNRAGSPLILTDAVMRGRAGVLGGRLLEPAADPDLATLPDHDPGVASDGDDVVYVIHTSGSTGEPKGVAVTHRGVLGLAADSCWDGEGHRRILSVAPYAFGVSTYELWVPLLRGGHLVLAPPGELDLGTLRRLFTEERISAVHLTAGLFRVFAEEAPESFATLSEVLTGGDVIAPTAVRRVLEACPGLVVRAMYGATEVSSFAAHAALASVDDCRAGVPVGRPMDTVDARLLDDRLAEVPDGEVGELHIAGERLAAGYFRSPGLTAEHFVTGPDGERMYRTGDLMRRGAGGLLEFAGRSGDQVKIRGYRVEPAEVEHALGQLPGVAHAAVVVREPQPGDKRLAAYVVPRGSGPGDLRTALGGLLPDYAVPDTFVELAALPLTPNGKLDRAALPEPAAPEPAATTATAPVGERQSVLCVLVARVLGVPEIGPDDSFFDLGGQSLQAMRLVARIQAEFGAELTVGDVFNNPTVAELDSYLTDLAATGAAA